MKTRLLLLILFIYTVVTLAYGVTNPLFEAPDEYWHFFTAVYIAENQKLPIVAEEYDPWLSQEAAQPPLYYLLAATIIAPLDTSQARDDVWLNPFGTQGIGNAAALTNRNQIIHTTAERWPWRGTFLAAHLLRVFSTLLGLGTLFIVYKSGGLLWPNQLANPLLATALVAFLPQFNFLHAAISNDPLIILLCSAALWQLIWLWQHPSTPKRLLLLGITIGLAALSKNTGVLLLLYSVGFLAVRHLKKIKTEEVCSNATKRHLRMPSPPIKTAVFIILPVLLIAGWLWWRNWQLYGDWTATNQFIRIAGGDRGYTLSQILAESGGLWRSLFAVFGWFNLLTPAWVYWLWNGLVGVGVVGFIKQEIGDWRPEISPQSLIPNLNVSLLLAGWVVAVYAGLLLFMLQTPAAQGRLLFPAILPLALGLAAGLANWRWRPLIWLAPIFALLTTVYSLWGVVAPAYTLPPVLDRVPPEVQPLNLEMGAGLTLLGMEMETETAVPGESIWFTLFWQAESVPNSPPELVIDILGRDLAPIGSSHSYQGSGQFPASQWPAGGIIADRMGVLLTEGIAAPVLAQLFVRLVGDEIEDRPSLPVAAIKIVPANWPESVDRVLAEIGEAVQLTAASHTPQQARPGKTITIDVQWQVVAPPQEDWTTLIHLAEPGQPPLAVGDNQPLNGDYPTYVWAAGENFADQYQLTIPDDLANGRYPLWLGMYNSDTIERLPLTINNAPQPNQVIQIGVVEIISP